MNTFVMTCRFGSFHSTCAELRLCLLVPALTVCFAPRIDRCGKRWFPATWDDNVMNAVEVPLANPIGSPKHVSADYYYRIPVRPVYQQYPVYAPGREPAGYMEELKKKEPVIIWDGSAHAPALRTEQDWIRAGEMVFSAASPYSEDQGLYALPDVRNEAWYRNSSMPLTPDGVLPFLHYVIRQKGKVELGSFSCAMCHTRVMPGGAVVKAHKGISRLTRQHQQSIRPKPRIPADLLFLFSRAMYAMPWLDPDPIDRQRSMSPEQLDAMFAGMPPGVVQRHRSSPFSPVQVPDLIGIKDRHYLDHTGLHRTPRL